MIIRKKSSKITFEELDGGTIFYHDEISGPLMKLLTPCWNEYEQILTAILLPTGELLEIRDHEVVTKINAEVIVYE
jgi:hypothetical protein